MTAFPSSNILLVLTSFFLAKHSLSLQLAISAFPEFQQIPNAQFLKGKMVTLNDLSRYSLHKYSIDGIPVISLEYSFDHKTVLSNQTMSRDRLSWIVVSPVRPFRVFSFALKPDTPPELQTLVTTFPDHDIHGLESVLAFFNSVDWTKSLLKSFYKNCSFPELHLSTQDLALAELKKIDSMFTSHLDTAKSKTTAKFLSHGLNWQSFVRDEYMRILNNFITLTVEGIFKRQTQDPRADIWLIDTVYDRVWKHILPKTPFVAQEVVDFRLSLEWLRSRFQNEVREFLETSDERDSYFGPIDSLVRIYDQRIRPLIDNKLFALISMLSGESEDSAMVGNPRVFIKKLILRFGDKSDVLSAQLEKYEILSFIIQHFIERIIAKHGYAHPPVSGLTAKFKKCTKEFMLGVREAMRSVSGLDADMAWSLVKMKIGDMLPIFLHKSPVEVYFLRKVMILALDEQKGFFHTELAEQEKLNGSNRRFIGQVVYLSQLLGGKALGGTKSVRSKQYLFRVKSSRSRSGHLELV